MTSKEALNYLAKILGLDDYPRGDETDLEADDYAFSCLLQLGKDLELLDKLKKYVSIAMFDAMELDEKIKIMEWLENDK